MGLFPEIEDQEDIERMTRNGTLAGLALALPVFGVFTTTALRLIGSDSAGLGSWFTFVGLGVFLAVPFQPLRRLLHHLQTSLRLKQGLR